MNGSILAGLLAQVVSNPIVVGAATVLAAAIAGLWLLGVAWAFRDMAHRSPHLWARYAAATWVLLSGPVLLPISLAVVGLLRPAQPAGDRRLTDLVSALRARAGARPWCPGCGAGVADSWVRCPACAAWLARSCPRCEGLTPLDAKLCPWCAWSPEDAGVLPEPGAPPLVGMSGTQVAAGAGEGALPRPGPLPAPAGVLAASSAQETPPPVVRVPLGGAGRVMPEPASPSSRTAAGQVPEAAAGMPAASRDHREERVPRTGHPARPRRTAMEPEPAATATR